MKRGLLLLLLLLFVPVLTFAGASQCEATQDMTITVHAVNGVNQSNFDEFVCKDSGGNLWVIGFDAAGNNGYGALSIYKLGAAVIKAKKAISFDVPYTYAGNGWSFTQTMLKGTLCTTCDPPEQTTYLMGTVTFISPGAESIP